MNVVVAATAAVELEWNDTRWWLRSKMITRWSSICCYLCTLVCVPILTIAFNVLSGFLKNVISALFTLLLVWNGIFLLVFPLELFDKVAQIPWKQYIVVVWKDARHNPISLSAHTEWRTWFGEIKKNRMKEEYLRNCLKLIVYVYIYIYIEHGHPVNGNDCGTIQLKRRK